MGGARATGPSLQLRLAQAQSRGSERLLEPALADPGALRLAVPTPSRRPRVLYLIDRLSPIGGAERFAAGLAAALPQDRFEPWICTTRFARPESRRLLAQAGVPHLHLGRDARWQLHRMAPLIALLARRRFDILHAHKFGSNVWGTLLGRSLGVPVLIAHEHNWSFEGRPLRVALDRGLVGRLATRVVTVSEASGRMMVEREGLAPEKLLVLPTAFVPDELGLDGASAGLGLDGASAGLGLDGASAELEAELGLHADAPVVVLAAVLREEKAVEVLIDAHRLVLDAIPDAQLLIAGDGPCRPALEQQISRLGLAGHARILGLRTDVQRILARADLAALPSDWEGMPLFALECMAWGTPLVATAVGGLPELIEHGVSGLLVGPRDARALADALISLLRDPARRRRLADAARARVAELSIERVAVRFADLYDQLLAEAGRA